MAQLAFSEDNLAALIDLPVGVEITDARFDKDTGQIFFDLAGSYHDTEGNPHFLGGDDKIEAVYSSPQEGVYVLTELRQVG